MHEDRHPHRCPVAGGRRPRLPRRPPPRGVAAEAAASPELTVVCEELAAAGCRSSSSSCPPRSAPSSWRSSAPTSSAEPGCRRSPPGRRWRSRSPSPARARTAITSPPPRRATTLPPARRRRSSRVSTSRPRSSSSRTGTRRRRSRRLSLFIVDADAPGLTRTIIPVEIRAPEKRYTLFFDDVQVGADRPRRGGRRLRQVFVGLNRAHHERGDLQRHRPLRASIAPPHARDREVWGVPIAQHQGIAHCSPRRRSTSTRG